MITPPPGAIINHRPLIILTDMKTKTFPLILALFLGLTLTTAAHAQDDETPAYFLRPLRVQTPSGKEPGIVDFARAFVSADQQEYALFSATLARIDGRQFKLPQDEHFTCLIDRPHGYLRAVYTIEGIKDPNQTLEVCYWRTDTDRRLVAVCYYNDLGTELLLFYDYNPATGLMTPLAKLPFQDFHEFLRELIVQLPREGKDIHMKRCWDGGPPTPHPPLGWPRHLHHRRRRRALPTARTQPTHHLRLPRTLQTRGNYRRRTRRPLRRPRRQSCPPSRHQRSRLRLAGQACRKWLGLRRLQQ